MPPAAFERQFAAFDAPLVDLIHDGGGFVWVHCRGRMRPVLQRFAEMGVVVLNPVEPSPMGDLTLGEVFSMVGYNMALEGNIETRDLMTADPEALRATIREAVDAGRGRRHILCPSSGCIENPEPTPPAHREPPPVPDRGDPVRRVAGAPAAPQRQRR